VASVVLRAIVDDDANAFLEKRARRALAIR
jgi:hypothetical protein